MKVKSLRCAIEVDTTDKNGSVSVEYDAKSNVVKFSPLYKSGRDGFSLSGCDAEAVFKLCKDLHGKASKGYRGIMYDELGNLTEEQRGRLMAQITQQRQQFGQSMAGLGDTFGKQRWWIGAP